MTAGNDFFSPEILSGNIWILLNYVFVVVFLMYFIFSLVVAKQITLMVDTVKTLGKGPLIFLGILHALIAFAVLFYFVQSLLH